MTLARILIAALLLMYHGAAVAAGKPLTVVELYTSQGCAACPPANAFLAELAEQEGLLALSFHVDYWNYLGWEDPFSSAVYSERQRQYAVYFDSRNVYTPQMVIQGTHQTVGSNRPEVKRAISAAASLPRIDMVLTTGDGGVTISLPAAALADSAKVFVVTFDDERITAVKRGENRGKELRSRNVVRYLKQVADWDGKATQIPVSYADAQGDRGAVLLQSAKSGAILGAAVFAID